MHILSIVVLSPVYKAQNSTAIDAQVQVRSVVAFLLKYGVRIFINFI